MSFRQKKKVTDAEFPEQEFKRPGKRRASEPFFGLNKVQMNPDLENGGHNKLFLNPIGPMARRFSKISNKSNDESEEKPPPEKPHVSDLFLKTDVAGLPELYEARGCANRLMWAVILTIAVFFMVSELYELFQEYQNNPILTTYSIMSEPEGMQVPTIYLCPMTPIHEGQRRKMNVPTWWEEERNVSSMFQSSGLSEGDENSILGAKKTVWEEIGATVDMNEQSDCDLLKDSLTTTERAEYIPKDIEDYFMKVGYPIDSMFKECSFNTDAFDCKSVVEEVFDRDYGKCFLLKDRQKFVQTLPGIGLSLALNLDTRKAYSKNPPLFDGIVMKIEHDFDMAGYRKLLLHPAQYMIVGLKATKYNLINSGGGSSGGSQTCRDAEDGEEDLKVLDSAYTLGVCRMDCVQHAVLKECGCILAMSSNYMKADLFEEGVFGQEDHYCSYKQMNECAYPFIKVAKNDEDFKECYKKCAVPCEYWEFNAEMSSVRFPSDMFLNSDSQKKKRRRRKREVATKKKKAWEKYHRIKRHEETFRSKRSAAIKPRVKRQDKTTQASTRASTAASGSSSAATQASIESSASSQSSTESSGNTGETTTESDYNYNYGGDSTDSGSTPTNRGSSTDSSGSTETATGSTVDFTGSTDSSSGSTEANDYGSEYGGYDDYEDSDSDLSSAEQAEVAEAKRQALIEACTEEGFNTQDWNDYIVVDIAYSNLQYTEITQENAISFTQTVSDVGGQIGLWVGCSIISFFKIFMVTGPLFMWGMRKKKVNKDKVGMVVNNQVIRNRFRDNCLAMIQDDMNMNDYDLHLRNKKLSILPEEENGDVGDSNSEDIELHAVINENAQRF